MGQGYEGWRQEIIEPFEALIAPRKLIWKEKFGLIRTEWLLDPDGSIRQVGPFGTVIEEASRLCCGACGGWRGWMRSGKDEGPLEVTTAPVRGWYLTLCEKCRMEAERNG